MVIFFLPVPPVSKSSRESNDCLRITLVLFRLLCCPPDHDLDDHDNDVDDHDPGVDDNDHDVDDHDHDHHCHHHDLGHQNLYLVSGMLQEQGSAWQGFTCSPCLEIVK